VLEIILVQFWNLILSIDDVSCPSSIDYRDTGCVGNNFVPILESDFVH
jgi:hypothetical protein